MAIEHEKSWGITVDRAWELCNEMLLDAIVKNPRFKPAEGESSNNEYSCAYQNIRNVIERLLRFTWREGEGRNECND
jgi:hypothetical protein